MQRIFHLFNILLLMLVALPVYGQTKTGQRVVTGEVVEQTNEPIVGAVIFAPDSKVGTTTDLDGKYSLTVPASEKQLIISYVGMVSYVVELQATQSHYKVVLQEDHKLLDEVVVTGYQTISKERTTGSYQILDKKSLSKKINPNLFGRLEGTIAGVQGRSAKDLKVRGISTLIGTTQPLVVVDGMPIEGSLDLINPANIESMTVLKDAAAASIYGARAANGVIVITTVSGKKEGGFSLSYDGTVQLTGKPDLDYLNRINSADLVDLSEYVGQRDFSQAPWSALERFKQQLPYFLELFTKRNGGVLSEAEYRAERDRLAAFDNRDQIREELLRSGVLHTHNLSLTHGSEKSRYVATLNYNGNRPTDVRQKDQSVGFSLRNITNFTDRFSTDISVSGNYSDSYSDDALPDAFSLFYSKQPYTRIKNEDGSYAVLPQEKSEYFIRQLQELGLEDEHYSPFLDKGKEWTTRRGNYTRLNAQVTYKITPELSANAGLQLEKDNGYQKSYQDKTSFAVRQERNNATIKEDNAYVSMIPEGGMLREIRDSRTDYTARLQLNYDNLIANDHRVTALVGAERRRVHSTATSSFLMGYDDISLGSIPYDAKLLANLNGTQSLSGRYSFNNGAYNYVRDYDDRFVSFYSNFSYAYLEKYNLTGSIRVDQSNLFGTDPSIQYKPLWSLGTSWAMHKEDFMRDLSWIDRLSPRLTYGIGGNIPKAGGPYLVAKTGEYNTWMHAPYSRVVYPPNKMLTWERTATLNAGLDFSFLRNRLSGSIDIYDRQTTNLLGTRSADPTLGWANLLLNYGSMQNRGFELSLNTLNISKPDFRWMTNFVFSYNANKLLQVDHPDASVVNFLSNGVQTSGKPANSLYSLKWAGLYTVDPETKERIELGRPHIYSKGEDGEKATLGTDSMDDLIHEGTMTPVWNGGLTNTLEYRDFSLSFSLVYYGGHKLRSVMAPYTDSQSLLISGYSGDASIAHAWRKAGDEDLPGTTPWISTSTVNEAEQMAWYGANIHVIPGDYIRLRDVVLSYSMPRKLLSTLSLQRAVIQLQANNLWYWTANKASIDPEAYSFASGTPIRLTQAPKTFTIGLSLTF